MLGRFLAAFFICAVGAASGRWLLDVDDVYAVDDAYIFFVYAQNLVEGHGLVYNPGGERVEGFSSFAWVILLSPVFLFLRDNGADFIVFLMTSGLAALSLVQIWRVLDLLGIQLLNKDERRVSPVLLLGTAWIVASPAWLLWVAGSGMDLALWTLLLCSCIYRFVSLVRTTDIRADVQWLSVLLVLMVLTRPEAAAWGLFFLCSLWLLARWRALPVRSVVMWPAISLIISYVALFLFRISYFGFPFPNTYYAKVSRDFLYNMNEGFAYLLEFLTGNGFASLAVLYAMWVGIRTVPAILATARGTEGLQSSLRFVQVFLGWCVLTAVLIAVFVGGDHFGGFRYLQPVYPVIFLFVVATWALIRPSLSLAAMPYGRACVFLLVGAALLTAPLRAAWYNIDRSGLKIEFEVAAEGKESARQLGQLLRAAATDQPVVGVTAAGGFKFVWAGNVFDLMGLNDVEMAHSPGPKKGYKGHAAFDKQVFWARQPEIVMPHLVWPGILDRCADLAGEDGFYAEVLRGLQTDSDFRLRYRLVQGEVEGRALCMYVRDDYLSELTMAGLDLMTVSID